MEAPSIQDQYEADSYLRAKEMVKNQRAFYGNLTAYCIIIPALAIINFLTTSFYWFFFPMLGWGLGLLFHGMAAFEWSPFLGKDWERRKIEEIIKKKNFKIIQVMEKTNQKYLEAQKRVKELREFYNHLFTFIVINILLAGINYYTNEWAYPWFLWATFGWGIGLAFDAMKTFRLNPVFNKEWEERKIREYMEKDNQKRWE